MPDLQNAVTAYIPEGEKDVDRLRAIGLTATTNVGGAGKWRDAYTQQLVAANVQRVVVLPDNDEPGRRHTDVVAASCHGHGLEVKIVPLPDVPPKGDVSDYLATHGRDELVALVQETKSLHAVDDWPARTD